MDGRTPDDSKDRAYAQRRAIKKLFISLTWQLGHGMIQKYVPNGFPNGMPRGSISTAELVALVQRWCLTRRRRPIDEVFEHNQTSDKRHSL